MCEIITLLFDGFETLDAFGPVEILEILSKDVIIPHHLCRYGYCLKSVEMGKIKNYYHNLFSWNKICKGHYETGNCKHFKGQFEAFNEKSEILRSYLSCSHVYGNTSSSYSHS